MVGNTNLFWTCVDLIDERARTVYYILGNDLIAAALSKTNDADAMIAVKTDSTLGEKCSSGRQLL